MKSYRLFSLSGRNQGVIKVTIIAMAWLSALTLGILLAAIQPLSMNPGRAIYSALNGTTPIIELEPMAGPVGTKVTLTGSGWKPGSMVLVYAVDPDSVSVPDYALVGGSTDMWGRLTQGFVVPSEFAPGPLRIRVIARAVDTGLMAQTLFDVQDVQPTPDSATFLVKSETTIQEVQAGRTASPLVTASGNVNIRSGPGTTYPIIGLLRTGQNVETTGVSPDGTWWRISPPDLTHGDGWVSARYVTGHNTGNVPVVSTFPAPQAAAQPVTSDGWRGEYFSNARLDGSPTLLRNDDTINFDWGIGSPVSGIPTDNFSVRWSQTLYFPAGTYRFYVRVDDGIRLWIDDLLLLDRWYDSPQTTHSAQLSLNDGPHDIRLEYYERRGEARVEFGWEMVQTYEGWKAEYFGNRALQGNPALVRGEAEVRHDWGSGSPGPVVPADHFSARWTRQEQFQGGTYVFRVLVDDGVRLWVDDSLILESWLQGSARVIQAERAISGGLRQLRVEYYEHAGTAQIELTIQRKMEPAGNERPQAVPGGPYAVDEGTSVTFDGAGSRDPDGKIVKYEWNFDYNGKTFFTEATGKRVTTRYPDGPATMTLALRVTDNGGKTHIATSKVSVRNVPPAAKAGGPYSGQPGSPIMFSASATDPSEQDRASLTYLWDFGDGTLERGAALSHTYERSGSYPVRVTVADKNGAQGTDTTSTQVQGGNRPPTAVINGPGSGMVGSKLKFSARDSGDADGYIVSCVWDFGDGNSSSSSDVSHSYVAPGAYRVTLTVTDNGGLTATAAHIVEVEQPPQVNEAPLAVVTGPATAKTGETIEFSGEASIDNDGSIVSHEWVFSDGLSSNGALVSRSFDAPGTYQVVLTVTDNAGLRATAEHFIEVEAVTDSHTESNQPPDGEASALAGEAVD